MSKFKETPITETDIAEYLVDQDDFQLELAVLRACKSKGFEATHGGSYEDPITKKTRQFDIRTGIRKGDAVVRLAVECKSLKNYYPLLVCRLPRLEQESYHDMVLAAEKTQFGYTGAHETVTLSDVDLIYGCGQLVGKSTSQVGRSAQTNNLVSGDGEIFDKWSQAISSSFDLVHSSMYDYSEDHEISKVVILPVLVVNDGTLWLADYDAAGNPFGKPSKGEECELFIGKEWDTGEYGVRYNISHLHIMTQSKFTGFLDRLLVNENYWKQLFPVLKFKRPFGDPSAGPLL